MARKKFYNIGRRSPKTILDLRPVLLDSDPNAESLDLDLDLLRRLNLDRVSRQQTRLSRKKRDNTVDVDGHDGDVIGDDSDVIGDNNDVISDNNGVIGVEIDLVGDQSGIVGDDSDAGDTNDDLAFSSDF
jgi:hypothetical protein